MSAEILRILVVFLGVIVVTLILVQQPKDGGISAFTGGGGGSGASGTVFGSKGGNAFFFRVTAIAMVAFTFFVIALIKVGDTTYSSDNAIVQSVEKAVQEEVEVPGQATVTVDEAVPGSIKKETSKENTENNTTN